MPMTSTTSPRQTPNDPIQDQLQYIGGNMVSRDEMAMIMRDAVRDGIRAAVSDPNLWAAAGKAMQMQAEQATGGWLISSVKAIFSKLGLVLLAGVVVYGVGGPQALVAGVKAYFGGKP